jgi:hypothetical protein
MLLVAAAEVVWLVVEVVVMPEILLTLEVVEVVEVPQVFGLMASMLFVWLDLAAVAVLLTTKMAVVQEINH